MDYSNLPHHHAVLIVSSKREELAGDLFSELTKLSPAHIFIDKTVLDIESARNLITWTHAPYDSEKIALVSFHTIGLEAQNSLLKILEEPRAGVRFILVTSNKSALIDTVLSRVHVMEMSDTDESTVLAEIFLRTESQLRMKLPQIVKLLSMVDEEERKDKEKVKAFILSLATYLSNKKEDPRYILKTLQVASYSTLPSSSGKTLLEYLSLLLPQVVV